MVQRSEIRRRHWQVGGVESQRANVGLRSGGMGNNFMYPL